MTRGGELVVNRNIKNTFTAVAGTASALSFAATPAFAQITNPLVQWDNICDAVGSVVTFISGLAGGIALVLLVIGGIQYMISGGDKVAVEQARGRITAAVVGLMIVFGGYLVINTLVVGLLKQTALCV